MHNYITKRESEKILVFEYSSGIIMEVIKMKGGDHMFTFILGGIGVIFDLLIICAIVVIGGKIVVKLTKVIKNIIDAIRG